MNSPTNTPGKHSGCALGLQGGAAALNPEVAGSNPALGSPLVGVATDSGRFTKSGTGSLLVASSVSGPDASPRVQGHALPPSLALPRDGICHAAAWRPFAGVSR